MINKIRNAFFNALLVKQDGDERTVLYKLLAKQPRYLHVIIDGDDDLMLETAKQVALLAHFPTFKEDNPKTRTRITILGKKKTSNFGDIFGNLSKVHIQAKNENCDKSLESWIEVPTDVFLEYDTLGDSSVDKWRKDHECSDYLQVVLNKKCLEDENTNLFTLSAEQFESLAMRVNAIYDASQSFDLIRAEDVEHVHEFDIPVKNFVLLSDDKVEKAWGNPNTDKESSRAMALSMFLRIETLKCLKRGDDKTLYDTLVRHLVPMSQSEHARWNVEKLINGFRPYTMEEVIDDENLCGDARKDRIKQLKNDPAKKAHNDLGSYDHLRRIDLGAVKYDSFLLLAMVKYWEGNVK